MIIIPDYIINIDMNENTHVVLFSIEPTNTLPCCELEEIPLAMWSDKCKKLLLNLGRPIAYNLLMQEILLDDYAKAEEVIELDNVYQFIIKREPKNIELINKLKLLIDLFKEIEDFKEDIEYLDFVKKCIKLETLTKSLGIILKIKTFYSPIECRNEPIFEENGFNFNDLNSNFEDYKYDYINDSIYNNILLDVGK